MSDDGAPRLHLLAAVASITSPNPGQVVEVAAAALDTVMLPALHGPSVVTSLQAFRRGTTLAEPRSWTPSGVDWSTIRDTDDLEGFAVTVTDPQARRGEETLAQLFASLPGPRRLVDGTAAMSETVVSWSLRRDAVSGGAIERALQDRASDWTQTAFASLDGVGGYLTLDRLTACPDGRSPYEVVTYRMSAQREFESHVWNPVWGMPLTDHHVELMGGPGVLPTSDGLAWRTPSGRWWLQASVDLEALTDGTIGASRDLLAPLLPPGAQAVTDYDEVPSLRV